MYLQFHVVCAKLLLSFIWHSSYWFLFAVARPHFHYTSWRNLICSSLKLFWTPGIAGGFRYTKMLRQFVTAGVWRLSDVVIGYPCTAPLLCSWRGIIRLSRSMSVWSYFHAPMNFLTSPHSPQHSYSSNIFIEYCIARGLLLSIFFWFSQ